MRTLGGVIVGMIMVVTFIGGIFAGFWCANYNPSNNEADAIEEVKED